MFPTTTTNGETQPASVLDAGTADGELSSSYVLHRSLHTKPLAVKSAKGHYLELDSGQLVLDACAGAAVACLGHGNEAVINAMNQQLSQMAYIHSQVYTAQPVEDLANLLIESTDHKMARVLFMNSGSEANEIAMKLARQYHLEKTPPEVQRDVFLSRRQSYHGASFATLALSGHLARQKRYMPFMLQNMRKTLPCNAYRDKRRDETDAAYVQRLADALENDILAVGADRVAGFFVETVGGASTGCTLPVPGYLMATRRVCDKYGILLMLDEIMCGVGRTGTFHAWQQENVVPDIQTIAKGLGGGFVPLGAVLVNERVVRALENGSGQFSHGQTFQSHVLCCATSAAVIRELIRPQVPDSGQPAETLIMRSKRVGKLLLTLLSERVGPLAHVGDVRGRGLFMAIELVRDKVTKEPYELGFSAAYKVHAKALKLGVATYPGQATADGVRGDHILLAPPFAITEEECLVIVSTLEHAIKIALE